MIDRQRLAVILTAAFGPAPVDGDKPVPATTVRGALRALDHEVDLLIIHTRCAIPMHDTIKEISDRMSQ